MRKITILMSTLVLVAMLLAACGGQEESTGTPSTSIPTMEGPTSAATSTEAATEGTETVSPGEGTGTPGVPVTGGENPSRISNQLDYNVWNQDGEQIGEVNDMVLDLDDSRVSYVIVGTGGFLELGERDILVPWDSLQLQTEGGDMTGGEQNAFILQTDQGVFANAPDVDVNSILPALGEPAGDWDLEIRNYWEGGGAAAPAGTQPTEMTAVPSTTGTASPGTVASPQATSGAGTSSTAAPETGTATLGATGGTGVTTGALQGVVLATEVLGSNITVGASGGISLSPGTGSQAQGTGTPGVATAMPAATGTPSTSTGGTSTPSTSGTGTPSGSTGTDTQGEMMNATIEDLIVDIDTGDIQYVVINSTFEEGERWIPIPLDLLRWDASAGGFALDIDQAILQAAPFFTADQFPDTGTSGWDTDFSDYWQNNSAGGGAEATTTP